MSNVRNLLRRSATVFIGGKIWLMTRGHFFPEQDPAGSLVLSSFGGQEATALGSLTCFSLVGQQLAPSAALPSGQRNRWRLGSHAAFALVGIGGSR